MQTRCADQVYLLRHVYVKYMYNKKTFAMREGSLEREDELPFLMKSLT